MTIVYSMAVSLSRLLFQTSDIKLPFMHGTTDTSRIRMYIQTELCYVYVWESPIIASQRACICGWDIYVLISVNKKKAALSL